MGMTYVVAREYGAPVASFEDETMAVDYCEAISDKMSNHYTIFYVPHVAAEVAPREYAALDETGARNGY